MEVSALILTGLSAIGYYLNKNGKQSRKDDKLISDISMNERPNSYNIYQQPLVNHARNMEFKAGHKQWQDSLEPEKTGVIPALYNTKSKREKKKVIPELKETKSARSIKKLSEAERVPAEIRKAEAKLRENPALFVRKTDLQDKEYGGWNKIIPDYHNNMVPFFRGSGTNQNMKDTAFQPIVERYTGIGPTVSKSKKESQQMFDPEPNFTNVFGNNLNVNDRQRFHRSELKTSQLPFKQTYVGSGVNSEYSSKGNDGFHTIYRPPVKTVNELRVQTNPKLTFKGEKNHAKHFVSGRTNEVAVNLNKPSRLFELGHKRVFTTTGDKIADTQRPNVCPSVTARTTATGMLQGSSQPIYKKLQTIGKVTLSDQPNYVFDKERNYAGNDNNLKNQMYQQDNAKTTIKQQTLVENYIPNSVYNKGKGYLTTKYTAKTTQKQSISEKPYTGNIGQGQHQKFKSYGNAYNMQINGLKEQSINLRQPKGSSVKLASGGDSITFNIHKNVRHTQHDNKTFKWHGRVYEKGARYISALTNYKQKYTHPTNDRLDSTMVEQHQSNPYTHSLNSSAPLVAPKNVRII